MSTASFKWRAIIAFVVAMFILLAGGYAMRNKLAPYPGKVVGPDGKVLFEKKDILAGQDVFQRYGLMDQGAVWGHGTQRGPEFSAATLHIVATGVGDFLARKHYGQPYSQLDDLQKNLIDVRIKNEIKPNRYSAATDTLTLTGAQVEGLKKVQDYWEDIFKNGNRPYAFLPDTIKTAEQRLEISQFFFWTAWVASTLRPGEDYTYTNNWPADPQVGNVPSIASYFWSIGGIVALLLMLGVFVYMIHRHGLWYGEAKGVSLAGKLIDIPLTSSQFKAAKFFVVVILLFLLQTSFGGLLAHYTVHPASFFLPFVAKWIPYNWAKTWHLQLAIFWIATTWFASAIYLAPIIGGREPKKQGLLVQLFFIAVLIVALGSLFGEVLGIKGLLGNLWFWFGHQGWEFLELGRFWQILLFVGMIYWLVIVYRAVGQHLKKHKDEFSALIWFYVFSAVLVVAFFGFGLLYGRGSHLTMADYWRWFVVHLWVESIFEFFGVAVISVLMVAMGLAPVKAALRVAYFTAAITFLSGIIGTGHHYFWEGGPSYWIGWGALFSSMEPVPLIVLVVRGLKEYQGIRAEKHDFPYKWPMYFLVASSFWNFYGAGIFGFLINLPIVNYYEHGTYLTMNHGHAALFGTYGMLSIALLLFSWRGLVKKEYWKDGVLKLSFWGLNGGLFLMTMGTLLPIGLMQTWTAFTKGLWVARSPSFFEHGVVMLLGNLRAIPDTVIIVLGVLPLAYFLLRTYPHLKTAQIKDGESVWEKLGVDL